ncbi:hypothetical protein niasHT_020832 [Heterodera trifolii]|uniref:Thiamine pyrophosphate enzyme central domain-containing protein n=1 Tax=Heterodera trifolii TaxID=157864 RepID=A0ABD2KLP9_9BILA
MAPPVKAPPNWHKLSRHWCSGVPWRNGSRFVGRPLGHANAPGAQDGVARADLVILAGAVCDFRLSYGRVLSPKCKVVTINRNREQMLKNHGVFWHSAMAIIADVGSTLVRLHQRMASDSFAVDGHQRWDAWLNALRSRERDKDTRNETKRFEPPSTRCSRAASARSAAAPGSRLAPRRSTPTVRCSFCTGTFFADGHRFVRLPVVALFGNDACWAQIARDQVPWFNSAVGCELSHANYDECQCRHRNCAVAEEKDGAGGNNGTTDDNGGQSTMINALIGRTNFREGSISV